MLDNFTREMENISFAPGCDAGHPDEEKTAKICSFWFEGVLLLVVGLFGILGNVTSIFVLSKLQTHNFFDSLLIALTTIDIIFIIFTIVDYSLAREFAWPWPENSMVWTYLIPKFTYPLNNMCFCSSVFLTVLIAGERYMAVCHPVLYRNMSVSTSVKQRLLLYLLPVLSLSIGLNIPKFFETVIVETPVAPEAQLIWLVNGSTHSLDTIPMQYETTAQLSELRRDPLYTKYYTFLTRLVVTGIIPMSALLFFNLNIYLGLKSARRRTQTCPSNGDRRSKSKTTTEMSLSLILLFIVAVFLCCHFPRLVLNMAEFSNLGSDTAVTSCHVVENYAWFQCLTGFSHLLLILNGSVNFLIYCSLNNNFKAALNSSLHGCYEKVMSMCMCRQPSKDTLTEEVEMDDLINNGRQGETVMTLMQ